jgi:glutamine amidotransferase
MVIQIIDFGVCNVNPLYNVIKKISPFVEIIATVDKFNADSAFLILPGVGSWDFGISSLQSSSFDKVIQEAFLRGTQILGICLGFQIFAKHSAEGKNLGLGLLDLDVVKVSELWDSGKQTNNGWAKCSRVNLTQDSNDYFYFTHSYAFDSNKVSVNSDKDKLQIKGSRITAAIKIDNLIGLQFHPEKSHIYGEKVLARILKNWEI